MQKVLVTGVGGQVGYEIAKDLAADFSVYATSMDSTSPLPDTPNLKYFSLNLLHTDTLWDFLNQYDFDLIINPAAYTATDQAEDDQENAFTMNANVPEILAQYAKQKNIPLIHFSTDYVFDGNGTHFRDENEAPAPLSVYGQSKLAGEKAIQDENGQYLIFRTSWIYSYRGKNFMRTMLKFASERETLNVVADQIGSPTSALFLAHVTCELTRRHFSCDESPFKHAGLFHLVNDGVTSWHGFTVEIVRQARLHGLELRVQSIDEISSDAFPSRIKRPLNSRLNCERFDRTFGIKRPSWQEGLAEVMQHLETPH